MKEGKLNQGVQSFSNKKNRQCSKKVCACNNEVCTYAYKQYGMKRWVFGIIITVISLGLIVPFLTEAICTIWFPDAAIGLNIWNQFVSIILGIVATILSIVSLIMSFKNYEDGLELHEKHVETLEKISSVSKDISDMKNSLNNFTMLTDSKSERNLSSRTDWEAEPVTIQNDNDE